MWPGPRSTSVGSGTLIDPAVWPQEHPAVLPQQTWAENWGEGAQPLWGVSAHLTQCEQGQGLPPRQVAS